MKREARPAGVDELLAAWRRDFSVRANVTEWRTMAARAPQYAPPPEGLPAPLREYLRGQGIAALYTHQQEAWELARAGRSVVVVTGTASGKTLCYNLPVLERLLRDPQARALYLFPTKALAQDQVEGLAGFGKGALAAAYDGDTPVEARPAVRARARIVVSNPDMLHMGILPHHTLWAEFFRNLQFVVIDELHAYRGVFGSHVANVVRRLKRVARFYGGHPQFILTSATIANPVELAERLVEEPVTPVERDGAGRGEKHMLIYNPPVVNRELGLRRSALLESVRLAQDLLHEDVQTIVFARSRRTVELILRYLQSSRGGEEVRGYRSGYLPSQRREIEQGLREGRVRGVVATNALELGIDIGGMGAAVLTGYPGTIAAMRQQAGRAGRTQGTALAVLVASADPLDQFLARHPDYLFDRSPEHALINPDNVLILLRHLRCAAFELPFKVGEGFGSIPEARVREFMEFLSEAGDVHASGDKFFWMADRYPADGTSLRTASAQNIVLQAEGEEGSAPTSIGQVDLESAYWMVHPQAVYLHEGATYVVQELDLERHIARLLPAEVDYYTEPRSETTVELLEAKLQAEARGGSKWQGEIRVVSQLTGYRKVKWWTRELVGMGELALPPSELETAGYWVSVRPEAVERLRAQGLWSNDPNNYGPNWTQQREAARRRDGLKCQICGTLENGRAHEVHHKTPFRTFDTWQEANQLHNLVTLCPSCHRRAEMAVLMRSGLAGLGALLGQLAPLFLMCDSHDLGVHSDPQSPLAEGRPAVLLYDRVPAGIGLSERLYELHAELVGRALEVVAACECLDGCPSCVGPAGESGRGGKREARALLEELAG